MPVRPIGKRGRAAALAFSGLALAAGTLTGAAPAAAAPAELVITDATTDREITAAGCTPWRDSAGPGGGHRRHVSCAGTGYLVRVKTVCDTGTALSAGYRFEYNKAECPGYGGRESSYDYALR
jgi:hypothetical protein